MPKKPKQPKQPKKLKPKIPRIPRIPIAQGPKKAQEPKREEEY
jgi:hypothetical protein